MFIKMTANKLLVSGMRAMSTKKASTFASKVLMVEPTHFFLNEETFADNKFMNKVQLDQLESSTNAKEEF
jgi:hypothetical protein